MTDLEKEIIQRVETLPDTEIEGLIEHLSKHIGTLLEIRFRRRARRPHLAVVREKILRIPLLQEPLR